MRVNRKRSIVFSNSGNPCPIVISDASNTPDDTDGTCQYGVVTIWYGGPIATISKKLPHVGPSAFHSEYTALRYATAHAVWLRQLLQETGWGFVNSERTLLMGDNVASNQLVAEHFIAPRNQYIYLAYHWAKEVFAMGWINPCYITSEFNMVDLLTKPVPRELIRELFDQFTGYRPNWWSTITTRT